ncbi:MAG: hypothetical protein E6K73_06030 [Candidatus Eisenbacteria bacterium]|uniref:Uncharacterized protein n=1 Tax=Eiseniibacteriota bacterium TaxID=2212470 RepID=A0A538SJ53_UNCEI|nr:MAG: hypothetical protein E6K73_06030 [Candidatus Eisenbacteria bacterium]
MSRTKIMNLPIGVAVGALALVLWTGAAGAEAREKIRIPVGRAEVVNSDVEVRTVAIAEPKIADAAVGSARTVVVNAKAPGTTSLVVYNEGGRYRIYDVEVYTPNEDKQVALHVRVAEVNDNAKRELGFDIVSQGSPEQLPNSFLQGGSFTGKVSSPSSPLNLGPATDGFIHFQRTNDWLIQSTWRMLEEKGDIRVLAHPTLMAKSGEKASFLAGGEFPIPVASAQGANAVTVTIEWKEFGVKLDFTPIIGDDGKITLKVAQEVSQIDFTNPLALNGFTVPTVITRKTSTTVELGSGEHLVIGGLKQTDKLKTVRRIPILGQIPIAGIFFSSTRTESVDRELLVVVSPELVQSASSTLPALPTDRPQR